MPVPPVTAFGRACAKPFHAIGATRTLGVFERHQKTTGRRPVVAVIGAAPSVDIDQYRQGPPRADGHARSCQQKRLRRNRAATKAPYRPQRRTCLEHGWWRARPEQAPSQAPERQQSAQNERYRVSSGNSLNSRSFLLDLVGRHLAVEHHRDDDDLLAFVIFEIGAALVEIEQFVRLAVRMEAIERAIHPIGGEPIALSVGSQARRDCRQACHSRQV